MRSAMTRGVGAIFAIGVTEAATKTAKSIAKTVEMNSYVKDFSTVAAQIQDPSKREKALLKITETQSKMALRETKGIISKGLENETTQSVIKEGSRTLTGFFGR